MPNSETELINEWTLVSDCLTRPDEAQEGLDILAPEMFTDQDCRNAFRGMQSLAAIGKPCDLNHLIEILEPREHLNQNLSDRLHEAAAEFRSAMAPSYYAKRVLEQHQKRQLRERLERTLQQLRNGKPLDEVQDEHDAVMQALQSSAAHKSSRRKLLVRTASAIKPQAVEWLWSSHLQLGALNIVGGPVGKGKSLLAADFAARVSTGRSWPDGTTAPQGRVLYCSAEEDAATTVVPRLMAAGADLEWIDIVDGLGKAGDDPNQALAIDLQEHLPEVEEKLRERGDYCLCVWDTFQSVSLHTEHKSNTSQKQIAQPLKNLAVEQNLCMLCVEHYSRGLQPGDVDNAILGPGLVRTARACWHVVEDPDDGQMKMFLHGKLNNANMNQSDLSWRFRIDEVNLPVDGKNVLVPTIHWVEPISTTVAEVHAIIRDSRSPGRPNDEFKRAQQFLLKALKGGPVAQSELKESWEKEDLTKRTIYRAKADLEIASENRGDAWYWSLP